MKIAEYYSHLNGYEWLMYHEPRLWGEIRGAIKNVDASKYKTKVSKERRTTGVRKYAPKRINKALVAEFNRRGWHQERTSYWVTENANLIRRTLTMEPDEQKKEIEDNGHDAIYSYNQTDFVKRRVAVEVQLGKYSFVAYDLFVKHLAFFVGDKIDLGVEIVPMKAMQNHMSSGVGYYEGELYNLIREGRGVPAVPLILIGIAP